MSNQRSACAAARSEPGVPAASCAAPAMGQGCATATCPGARGIFPHGGPASSPGSFSEPTALQSHLGARPHRAGRGVSRSGRLSPRNTTGNSQPEKPTLQHERLFKTDARTACKVLPAANFPGGGCDHHPLPSLLAVPEAWCLVPGAGLRTIFLIPCPLCTAGIVFELVKCIYLAGVMSQGMISAV